MGRMGECVRVILVVGKMEKTIDKTVPASEKEMMKECFAKVTSPLSHFLNTDEARTRLKANDLLNAKIVLVHYLLGSSENL